ncbi:MAG: NAD(P)/FAD-dependent oxidoreductase, partial [Acidimicrobiales bacterium]
KCCGDGLTAAALRRLERLGLDPGEVPSWEPVSETFIQVPDGRCEGFPMPADGSLHAVAAKRMDLDAALVSAAVRQGVTLLEGRAVKLAEPVWTGQAVELTLEGGERMQAPYVIAADGMWSAVVRTLGMREPGYLGDWHALRQYFTNVGPQARKGMWVWFDDELVPGYAWSFPLKGGMANVGFGVPRSAGKRTGELKKVWAEFLSRPPMRDVLGPDAEPAEPLRTWPIPARLRSTQLSGVAGRVLVVGDAARAVDCLTGEGIAQALESGELAAQAATTAGILAPDRAEFQYREAIRTGMAVDDKMASLVSRILATEKGRSGWIRVAGANGYMKRHFIRWLFEDYPRAALFTPGRWERGMLNRQGAFATGTDGGGTGSSRSTPSGRDRPLTRINLLPRR